ncbi:MAG TPA: hypothetical protein VND93_29910 [Myxococcales bacterium]|nr:hypothetical protein [Myxococcales bacterium]
MAPAAAMASSDASDELSLAAPPVVDVPAPVPSAAPVPAAPAVQSAPVAADWLAPAGFYAASGAAGAVVGGLVGMSLANGSESCGNWIFGMDVTPALNCRVDAATRVGTYSMIGMLGGTALGTLGAVAVWSLSHQPPVRVVPVAGHGTAGLALSGQW